MLKEAHAYWETIVRPGDTLIDATCGNGYDTLILARLLQGKGQLFSYDIQKEALERAKSLISLNLSDLEKNCLHLRHASHESFDITCAKLIVYNLGYLPRGDKSITTTAATTLNSLRSALSILSNEGAITITCYSGHPEGQREEEALLAFTAALPPDTWLVHHHRLLNRHKAPSLILITHVKGRECEGCEMSLH